MTGDCIQSHMPVGPSMASEKKYEITDLETLAVVWGFSHSYFHHYLYGKDDTVFTAHTAVKAVLEADNPTAKHARWWTRVFGRGVRNILLNFVIVLARSTLTEPLLSSTGCWYCKR